MNIGNKSLAAGLLVGLVGCSAIVVPVNYALLDNVKKNV